MSSQHPTTQQVWDWLESIPDPEIPVLSIVDLGILRDVSWNEAEPCSCVVTITPTYSGCPAVDVIAEQIRQVLRINGLPHTELRIQLAPAWTTDWLTERGRDRLREFGIVPPVGSAPLLESPLVQIAGSPHVAVPCPKCGSSHTHLLSRFGSTACKSLYRCLTCREPFDHFRAH